MKTAIAHSMLLACSAAAAAPSACPPQTRIGISDLGYSSFRTDTGFGGISVDVANELARRTGCKITLLWYPRGRLFVELAAGRIDLTMGAVRTPERDAYATYLPYAYVQYSLVLSTRVAGRYASLSDFVAHSQAHLNITRGVQYGVAIETALEQLNKAGRLEVVSDFDTVFNKLDAGRTDGTLASPPIYASHIKRTGMESRVTVVPLPESPPQWIGLYAAKKTVPPDLLRLFAGALRGIVADKTINTIYGNYMGEATTRQVLQPGTASLLTALAALQ